MSTIVRLRARNVGFSQPPDLLRDHLVGGGSAGSAPGAAGGGFGRVVCTVVELETSDGAVGVGTAGAFTGAAKSVIEEYLAPLVIGEDVRRHERVWHSMYRSTVRFGRRGPAVSAISAIDIAGWDAHGQEMGVSAADLLGGLTRKSVPVYASRLYALDDLAELAAEAKSYTSNGIGCLKQRFGWGPEDGRRGMARNIELVRTVREAVGPDVKLAADAYMGWDIAYALEMAERLREFDLSWIEEPLMPEQVELSAELRRRAPWQRWSCGEHSYTKWDFAELIRLGATDILQPDMNRVGGLTEGRKIAALAETAGLPLIPHGNESHNLAIAFSQVASVCPMVEYFPNTEPDTGNELFWKLFEANPVAHDGVIDAPAGPGLGVRLLQAAVGELEVGESEWITA